MRIYATDEDVHEFVLEHGGFFLGEFGLAEEGAEELVDRPTDMGH